MNKLKDFLPGDRVVYVASDKFCSPIPQNNIATVDDPPYSETYRDLLRVKWDNPIEGRADGGFFAARFAPIVEVPNDATGAAGEDESIKEFIKVHAERLVKAVNDGEINNSYAARGFLWEFVFTLTDQFEFEFGSDE